MRPNDYRYKLLIYAWMQFLCEFVLYRVFIYDCLILSYEPNRCKLTSTRPRVPTSVSMANRVNYKILKNNSYIFLLWPSIRWIEFLPHWRLINDFDAFIWIQFRSIIQNQLLKCMQSKFKYYLSTANSSSVGKHCILPVLFLLIAFCSESNWLF